MKLRIKGALFHCGRCRKSYSSPFGHVCVSRLDRQPRRGRVKFAPKVTASAGNCPKCHKTMGNPLTHTCTVKTDFKKRQAIAKKAARPVHLYETCRDADCKRTACLAYKEGREEGYTEGYQHGDEDGYVRGYDKGRTDGYAQGYADGMAACPRKHG